MKVVIKEVKAFEQKLEVGDVVVVHDSPYLIAEFKDTYIAKGFDGKSGSTGYHASLESLENSLKRHDATFYKKNEYELVLRKK